MTSMPAAMPDRRLALLSRDATFNGVDYAEVRHGEINVHFINRVRVRGTLAEDRPPVTLTVSGAVSAPVVRPVDEDTDWSTDTSGRPVLRVTADLPDAPARYLLTVHSGRIDPCLSSASITIHGPGDTIDGGAGQVTAGSLPGGPPVPVDYLAKDFASFLTALSSFSAARYPLWTERSEADFGVMLMEALSALADELSYLQDRVAAEATIGTATQRLSLVRHVRLVDYEPVPALAASTVLQFDVAPAVPGGAALPDVIQVQALGGQAGAVDFVAGPGFARPGLAGPGLAGPGLAGPGLAGPVLAGPVLAGTVSAGPELAGQALGGTGTRPALDARWNRYDRAGRVPQLVPYLWDPSVPCLRQGATSMWVNGHGHGFYSGQQLLIDTAATDGDPPNREIVRVAAAEERTDPVQRRPVTLIRWAEGLTRDHDLTQTELAGNLLPAVHGRVTGELFTVPGGPQPSAGAPDTGPLSTVSPAIVRGGPPAHCLFTLAGPLAWQAVPARDGGPAQPRPVLTLQELAPTGLAPTGLAGTGFAPDGPAASGVRATWQWVPRLIDAGETARAFTITPERYSPAAPVDGMSFSDYDGDGATVRFGGGAFGRPPVPGATFRARYLAGGGEIGNVAAGTIVAVAPGDPANGLVWRCTNPFAATGGADPETHSQIRDRAPRQFGNGLLSLAGPADYQAAAQLFSLAGPASPAGTASSQAGAGTAAWARQAVAAARWTGSWLSITTIADPVAREPAAAQLGRLAALTEQLDARRLAGTDASVSLARYRWLDLRISCAARPGYRPGGVAAAVLARLAPGHGTDGATGHRARVTGFFGRDKWTFGQSLDASALMAAVQSCPGVAGVTRVEYRWARGPALRGGTTLLHPPTGEWRPLRATLGVAPGEILRIDNDPEEPGHGLLFVTAGATR